MDYRLVVGQATHCCKLMTELLNDKRSSIDYVKRLREYFIACREPSSAGDEIYYCPWCGTKLPESLRNKFYETLEKEYGLTPREVDLVKGNVPEEFKTDAWWKKREL